MPSMYSDEKSCLAAALRVCGLAFWASGENGSYWSTDEHLRYSCETGEFENTDDIFRDMYSSPQRVRGNS
jgi:hypothetical protein